MTKSCPVCGASNEDSANFCIRCGYNFDQHNSGQSAENFHQNDSPFANVPPDYNFNLVPSLESLRRAFSWLFLGLILFIIPLIILPVLDALIAFGGLFWQSFELMFLLIPPTLLVLGGFIAFVGVIFLISGFGKISKTSLSNADYYRSTRNWLLASLFGLFIIVMDLFFIVPILLAFKVSDLLWPVGMMGIALILYLVSYIKLIKSLKFLSKDLQVKKLHNASNYLYYSLIMNIILIILLPILLFVSISAIVHSLSSDLISQLGELNILLYVVPIIILFVLQAIGCYFAYTGIDEFESRYHSLVTANKMISGN
jgi:hypothetical protein